MGRDAHHEVRAEWVLNPPIFSAFMKNGRGCAQFRAPLRGELLLGYDPVSERYVLHLLDVFAGRFSETLGYGTRDGTRSLVFEYPDGPFHTGIAGLRRMTLGSGSWNRRTRLASGQHSADLELTARVAIDKIQ